MFNFIARYLLLLVTLLALAACNAPPGSEAVAEPAATVSPEPWPTIRPTATREPTPTAAPTATEAATATPATTSGETPGSGTPSLTEEQYHHGKLGVTWTRPDNTWQFRDQVPAPNPQVQPLVMLGTEDGQRTILLSQLDIPPALSRVLSTQFDNNRKQVLEQMSDAMGIPVDEARVTEVSGFPAILVQLDTGAIVWTVIRPNGILYIAANGFETPEDVQPLLAGLELVDVPDTAAESTPFSELPVEEQHAALVDAAETNRELTTEQSVPFEVMTRDQLRQHLEETVEKETDPEEVTAEDQMLKLLKLIPQETDLLQLSLDLYGSQIAGFYETDEATFFLVRDEESSGLSLTDRMTFVHEYVHALQDQHFNLDPYPNEEEDPRNDDERKAWQALVEGDAQLATGLYMINSLNAEDMDELSSAGSEVDTEVLERTPGFLRESLVFPYLAGSNFIGTSFKQGGWDAVNQLWETPPVSTKQILFPETYPDEKPVEVTLPEGIASALGAGWSEPVRNVWGAFGLQSMLNQQSLTSAEPNAVAAGWAGDRYLFLTNGQQGVFVMEIAWTDAEAAGSGQAALQEWLELSGLNSSDANRLTGDGRTAYLRQEDTRLRFAIGDEVQALNTALGQLGWE